MRPIIKRLRPSLLLSQFFILLGITSLTATADAIEDANRYAVRIKSSVSNSIFFDGGSGTSSGAGFLAGTVSTPYNL